MENIYTALALELGVSLTIVFISAIALIWLYNKYGRSPQLMIAMVSSIYALLMSQLIFGAFGLHTFLNEIQKLKDYPGFATALTFGVYCALVIWCCFKPSLPIMAFTVLGYFLTFPILGCVWGYNPGADFWWKAGFLTGGGVLLIIAGVIAISTAYDKMMEKRYNSESSQPAPDTDADEADTSIASPTEVLADITDRCVEQLEQITH